ncbi:MAG: CBS domain-containing protein, partial [Dehalococcoidia bacterium]
LMMIGGAVLLLAGGALQGLWFILIGWFLVGAARGEAESLQLEAILSNLTAKDVMRGEWATVTPGEPISVLVDDFMIGRGERAVVVANDGAVAGILTVNDIRQIPRSEWVATPAQTVMTPRERVTTVTSTTPAVQVLMIMAQEGINQVPVVDAGRMIGLITRRELIARIQLAESLGDDARPEPPRDPPVERS